MKHSFRRLNIDLTPHFLPPCVSRSFDEAWDQVAREGWAMSKNKDCIWICSRGKVTRVSFCLTCLDHQWVHGPTGYFENWLGNIYWNITSDLLNFNSMIHHRSNNKHVDSGIKQLKIPFAINFESSGSVLSVYTAHYLLDANLETPRYPAYFPRIPRNLGSPRFCWCQIENNDSSRYLGPSHGCQTVFEWSHLSFLSSSIPIW